VKFQTRNKKTFLKQKLQFNALNNSYHNTRPQFFIKVFVRKKHPACCCIVVCTLSDKIGLAVAAREWNPFLLEVNIIN